MDVLISKSYDHAAMFCDSVVKLSDEQHAEQLKTLGYAWFEAGPPRRGWVYSDSSTLSRVVYVVPTPMRSFTSQADFAKHPAQFNEALLMFVSYDAPSTNVVHNKLKSRYLLLSPLAIQHDSVEERVLGPRHTVVATTDCHEHCDPAAYPPIMLDDVGLTWTGAKLGDIVRIEVDNHYVLYNQVSTSDGMTDGDDGGDGSDD